MLEMFKAHPALPGAANPPVPRTQRALWRVKKELRASAANEPEEKLSLWRNPPRLV